jgi:hypothetical protein
MAKLEDVNVNTWTYVRVANGVNKMTFVLGNQRIHMPVRIAEDFAVKLEKAAARIRKAKVGGKVSEE